MTAHIGIQLYAVKGPWSEDQTATLDRIRSLGIRGVEAAGFGEPASFRSERIARARQLRERVAASGLELVGVHSILPDPADADWLFEELAETGTPIAISSTPERVLGFTRDVFDDRARLARFAARFNELAAMAANHGMRLGYHNHWFEWVELDGVLSFDRFVDELDPSIALEIDLFWAQSAGQNLPELIAKHGSRVEFVHVKDGDGVMGAPQVAAGSGEIRLAEALHAGRDSVRWRILELDVIAPDADVWDVVSAGADWLKLQP